MLELNADFFKSDIYSRFIVKPFLCCNKHVTMKLKIVSVYIIWHVPHEKF